jgi:methylglyoxal reductase
MKYMEIGRSGLKASVIALGTWGLGGGKVWSDAAPTAADACRLLDAAEDCGINYIDTAPVYGTGTSEELLAKALKGRRDRFLVQSKVSLNWRGQGGIFKYSRDGVTVCNDTTAGAIRRDVEDSLRRLGTDWLDIAVVHYVNSKSAPVEETMQALEDLKKEGLIRAAGLSNSQPADFEAYEMTGTIDLVQEFFSLLAPFHGRDYFPVLADHGATFQVYGALEEGFLAAPETVEKDFPATDVRGKLPWVKEPYRSGIRGLFQVMAPMAEKYNCSYANLIQAWTLRQFPNLSLLIGCRRPDHLQDTCKCLDFSLTDQDAQLLTQAAAPYTVEVLDK